MKHNMILFVENKHTRTDFAKHNFIFMQQHQYILKTITGFTLIELLITGLLSAVMSMAVASLLIFSIQQFNILIHQHKIEEEMLWASYHIRGFLSQAINIHEQVGTTCSLPNNVGASMQDQGFIVENYTNTCASTPMAVIAVFPRENAVDVNRVNLFTTAIFYQAARATASDGIPHSGKLYFDVGEESGERIEFLPDETDIIYTGLHSFEVEDVEKMDVNNLLQNNGGSPTAITGVLAKSAKITLTFRYFLFANGENGQFYDYATTNSATLAYRDVENVVHINFHNNIMIKCADVPTGCDSSTSPTYKERIFGNIYFYKMVIPPEMIL